ncbi:MAG: 1-deoxy-D-xylulose-5-phosphate synthase [Solirubrobacterales bacterium]
MSDPKPHRIGPLLAQVEGPSDLSDLDDVELQQLAEELRTYIIDVIGEIGGHFGANLGTCEIAVALHSLLDSPRDKILWDVGHQAYPHKVLTGRMAELPTIRQYGGLAPFCSIPESEHDIMGAGHASTSISYGLGLKEAMRRGIGEDGRVVAVSGDGALTGGVAYEAMHAAGGLETPMVILLNDNGMSISPNVGALASYFQRARLKPGLFHAREGLEDRLTRLPLGLGGKIEKLGPEIKSALKAYWAPGLLFEELDLAYVGPIDGHDVAALRKALSEAIEADRPVVVHAQTVKGRGFAPAEEGGLAGMEKWHAAKPGSIVDGEDAKSGLVPIKESDSPEAIAPEMLEKPAPPSDPPQYTAVFADAMVQEAEADPRVAGITAAMAGGAGLQKLADDLPGQYFDVGIAEQNAVLMAAGIALQGGKPVCAIYSTFLQRAFDQLVHDVCLQNLDVTFAMDRSGLVGDDGPTHHGAFDIAYLRPLPNIVLMAPRDEAMLVRMLRTALAYEGPAAFRYPRGAAVGVELPEPGGVEQVPIGTGETLENGERVALVGYGTGVGIALDAARILGESGVRPTVVDARFAKPLDVELLERLALSHDLLVTIEEGVLPGGFGSGVLEHLENSFPEPGERARVLRIGLPDRYVTHGKPDLLHEEVGFTGGHVAERVLTALGEEAVATP